MPLTVITGIYGMNFHHMPELEWRWGYPVVMAVMAGVMGLVLLFFRRKGLLGRPPEMPPLAPLPPLQPPRTGMTATMAIHPGEGTAAADGNRAAMIAADGATPTVSATPSRGRS
jgi:hypothetical protein